ncbi:MAG: MBL fold metallo-hydrolase [Methanomassiliicoccus sp.]|nr:MBL fold metallo-hydrolase [Methanomassiliicoccus sp.]
MSKIIEGVYILDNPSGANTYILIDHGVTLIDVGMRKNVPKIKKELEELGFSMKDIKTIIITHAHHDHMQGLAEIVSLSSAKVMVGEEDADVISGAKPMPLPKGAMGLVFRLLRPMMRFEPVPVDVRLKDGDIVDVLGGLKVVPLKGHTPGNIGLIYSSSRLMFSSDTVSNRKDRLQPPALYKCNKEECDGAIERLSKLNMEIMLPGHGPPIRPDASGRVRTFLAELKRL